MNGSIVPAQAPPRRSTWGAVVSFLTAILYGASPIDLLPDLIPILGWSDDVVVVVLLLSLAWKLWQRRKPVKAPPQRA